MGYYLLKVIMGGKMGLQLKSDNDLSKQDISLGRQEGNERNQWKPEKDPWDYSKDNMEDMYEEPKVVYNSSMADLQGQQRQESLLQNVTKKLVVALIVGAILIFGGKAIVSVVMPEGIDVTSHLNKQEAVLAKELEETFLGNPTWATNVFEYSKSDPVVSGAEDIGVVYMDGKQIGVHIPTAKYMIFNTRVGDGEQHMYNNTSYPFDDSFSILDTVSGKATVYVYYNTERNDCIFFVINNTTNRIVSMTYYCDYKKVCEELESVFE